MNLYRLPAVAFLLCSSVFLSAQDKSPVKFGKVSPADFSIQQVYDSGASAVVIADIGNSVFEGNAKGWFSLVFKRLRRVKILDKKGFDAASVKIPLYVDGSSEEKLIDLKAYTYNLENGKVVETKLENASIFKDKLDAKHLIKKFTFPSIREGSIIEYSYTVESDFIFNLQPWLFQDEYPCLWSEYKVEIPEFFQYVTLNQGYMHMKTTTDSYNSTFRISVPGGSEKDERGTIDGVVNSTRWVLKNIPALKLENFTSSLKNYISGVEFQLAAIQFKGQMPHDMMGNWRLLSEKLLAGDHFGASLAKNNNWLDDDLKTAMAGISGPLEKARKIFAYVRDNSTCTDHSALYSEASLKESYKKHSGNVADINLLLVAMLRHEGINADPLILSTKDNGFTNELYPVVDRFNYVVCHTVIDGTAYDLDASDPYNGFNHLPAYCYNGHARIITKEEATPIYFMSDSLKEQKTTSVIIANDEKGGMNGEFKSQLGYFESYRLRKKLKGDDKNYFKDLSSGNGFEWKLSDAAIDSLKKPEMPALLHYGFSFKPAEENVIYFNPLLNEGYKENPFKSTDRTYPVEMDYTFDETYVLNMEVPKGYTADEIPKSVKVAYNENEGFFEYLIQKSADNIQLRARIKLNKATFAPEDYGSLRDFFGFVVKKESEQIVFKKK